MEFPKGTRTEKNKVFIKFFAMHKSMISRCYNPKNSSYHNYGGKGITVHDSWLKLDDFLNTIDEVDGFNLEKIMNSELQLDKDIKYPENTIYSKENCMFVSPSENSGFRPSTVKKCIAVDPNYKIYEFHNREKFCREHGLNPFSVWNCLQDKIKTVKGWQFFYEENFSKEKIIFKKTFIAVSPDLKIHEFQNISQFAKDNNLSAPNISMVLSKKNKHHKNWKFFKKDEFDIKSIEDKN